MLVRLLVYRCRQPASKLLFNLSLSTFTVCVFACCSQSLQFCPFFSLASAETAKAKALWIEIQLALRFVSFFSFSFSLLYFFLFSFFYFVQFSMLLMLLNCYWNVLNSEIFFVKNCTIGRLLIPALAFILFSLIFCTFLLMMMMAVSILWVVMCLLYKLDAKNLFQCRHFYRHFFQVNENFSVRFYLLQCQ